MNSQSTAPHSDHPADSRAAAGTGTVEDDRRLQLIEVTIDCLAELGFVGTTLAQIAMRAGVSPGLVAHYFGDKDGLLGAAFRRLGRRTAEAARARLHAARTPRGRIQAIIDANLAPAEFERRSGMAWLAFWGQLLHHEQLKRVQQAFQRRTLTNLRISLRQLMPRGDADPLATMIASMIDGVWLRAALSEWTEADSEGARALLTAFVDGRLLDASQRKAASPARGAGAATAGRNYLTTINPATGEVLGEMPIAQAGDVDRAVERARLAQRSWSALSAMERGRILRRASERLRDDGPELAQLETRDTGRPIRETSAVDIGAAADCLEYCAGAVMGLGGEPLDPGPGALGYTRREALGVVAGIGAWGYPLQIACSKSAPALACGNAIIYQPADLTPLTAVRLAELYAQAGLPAGLFQVLHGGAGTARLLSEHSGIAAVSLPGQAGSRVAATANVAGAPHPLSPEPGARSTLIVFDDAAIEHAVSGVLRATFCSAGDLSCGGARVYVHRNVRASFTARLRARVAAMRVGDPLDPATEVGALISAEYMEMVLGNVARGRAEGARLVIGGQRVTAGSLARGYFVQPAVFDQCEDRMGIVRGEAFGPVMAVLEFDDEQEVVARANATGFGLAAAVFTRDIARAHRVTAALAAGACWINHFNVMPSGLPAGYSTTAGWARGSGRGALEHYTQLKSVYVSLADTDAPFDSRPQDHV